MKTKQNNTFAVAVVLIAMVVVLFGEMLHPCFHTSGVRHFTDGTAECTFADGGEHSLVLAGAEFCPLCANILVSTVPEREAHVECRAQVSESFEYTQHFIAGAVITAFPRGPPCLR